MSGNKPKVSNAPNSGIKPALQGRSKQRRDELISAGMELMRHKNFADISIIELTASCGYSVGTFYSRFEDKESFFNAVQNEAIKLNLENLATEFQGDFWRTASNQEFFRKMVDVVVDGLLGPYRGVIKASIILSGSNPQIWVPIRDSGVSIRELIMNRLKDRFLKNDPARSIETMEFAMQMFYGTLVQAILNDPGPVHFEDDNLRKNLTRMLVTYTELEPE